MAKKGYSYNPYYSYMLYDRSVNIYNERLFLQGIEPMPVCWIMPAAAKVLVLTSPARAQYDGTLAVMK